MIQPTSRESYYAQALDWDEQRRLSVIKRSIRNGRLAWANGILAGVAIATIAVLVPLKTFIPIIVRVDTLSGAYDVSVGWPKLDMSDAKMDRTKLADLGRYVTARESFTQVEAERNYKTAYLMSCGSERERWDAYYRPEKNPMAPLRIMQKEDSDAVDIQNFSALPTDKANVFLAQVRFEKTTTKGTGLPTAQRYIATIAFHYDPANVPKDIANLQYNALGFCADQYRVDTEGPPRQIKPVTDASRSADASRQGGQ